MVEVVSLTVIHRQPGRKLEAETKYLLIMTT